MGSRAKTSDRIGRTLLALGALACALASFTTRAEDACTALLEGIEIPPELRKFLDDPKVQTRIAAYANGKEPFTSFYNDVEAWLMLGKGAGKARLRVPGGEPLLGFYKRNKYGLAAKLRVDRPGEVSILLDLGSSHVSDAATILDLQSFELYVISRLFSSFGEDLRKVNLTWKLDQGAPEGFADHMMSLGFSQPKTISRCALPARVSIAVGATLFGTATGGFLSIPADDAIYFADDPYGHILPWSITGAAIGGGAAAAILYYGCKPPSKRGGDFQLEFTRAAPADEAPKNLPASS